METATIELVTPSAEQILAQFRRGITKTPGVCGGDPCIGGTRIPVWVLEQSRRLGMTEGEILLDYPSLSAADLIHAWAYVANHTPEIDEQIRDNEEA